MTDYRLRNHDLLYAKRGPQPRNWRLVAIVSAVSMIVLWGVVTYLTDRFNPASTGFNNAPAPQATAAPNSVHLAKPTTRGSGS